jgi:hypothetical protein
MKSGMLAVFGAMGLLVFTGPVHQLTNPQHPRIATAPSWIALPSDGAVSRVAYTGNAGAEASSGIVDVVIDGDADRATTALKLKLAANGFVIDDRLTSVDQMFGASSLTLATDATSGRTLQILRLDTPTGAIIRLSYTDPASRVALAD